MIFLSYCKWWLEPCKRKRNQFKSKLDFLYLNMHFLIISLSPLQKCNRESIRYISQGPNCSSKIDKSLLWVNKIIWRSFDARLRNMMPNYYVRHKWTTITPYTQYIPRCTNQLPDCVLVSRRLLNIQYNVGDYKVWYYQASARRTTKPYCLNHFFRTTRWTLESHWRWEEQFASLTLLVFTATRSSMASSSLVTGHLAWS
jgi:hypothetical protein